MTGIRLVQNAGISGAYGSHAGIAATLAGVAAGGTLVLAVQYNSTAALPALVSDTSGNTWHYPAAAGQNPPLAVNGTTQNVALVAWATGVAAAASVTVTLSWGSAQNAAFSGSLSEFSGTGAEVTGVAGQEAGTQVHLPGTAVPFGALVAGAAAEQFTAALTPTAPMAAFSGDATGSSAYALAGPALSFAPDWGAAAHAWVAAAAVFAPAAAPPVSLRQIDGGPTYYASSGFSNAASSAFNGMAWDDPRFFPIGMDYPFYSGNSTATFKSLGLNFAHRVTSDTDLSLLRSAGIWALPAAGSYAGTTGAETFGWHVEEPASWSTVGSDLPSSAGLITGRLLQVSLTWNQFAYGPPSGTPGGTMQSFMTSLISSADGPVHLNVPGADIYWFAGSTQSGAGSVPYITGILYATGTTPTADQGARGPHYGDMVDWMRGWLTSYPAPIGAPYIETDDGLVGAGGRAITPPELNWAVWSTIIHGARWILYFGTTSDDGNTSTFGLSTTVQGGQSVSNYSQAQATNALVTALAPVINAPFADYYLTVSPYPQILSLTCNDAGIDAMAKFYAGGYGIAPGYYIFATTRESETTANISATFTTAGRYSGPVTVVNESRTVTAVNGVFSDTFATGAAVHIYQVPIAIAWAPSSGSLARII